MALDADGSSGLRQNNSRKVTNASDWGQRRAHDQAVGSDKKEAMQILLDFMLGKK